MRPYEDVIRHLFSLKGKMRSRPDLTEVQEVATLLDSPHKQFPTIHIAGTNGKGSVALKLAEALRLGGYRVGLYSSPHLFSYRERIKINGDMISKQATVIGLEKLFTFSPKLHFFEISTFLAFNYFANQHVDIAIIETGIGGRLDTTNIISPILSVITNVEYDHQNILGHTRTAIAREKGGVIKAHTPILLGPRADLPILRKMSHSKNAPLYLAGAENRDMAGRALEIIHTLFPVDSHSKQQGLSKCPPFRLDVRGHFLLDVAHNPSGFKYLFDQIKKRFSPRPLYLLLALATDKDLSGVVELFKAHVDEIGLFPSKHPRLRPPLAIANELVKGGYYQWKTCETASNALDYFSAKPSRKRIVIAGSFYMMEEVMRYFS